MCDILLEMKNNRVLNLLFLSITAIIFSSCTDDVSTEKLKGEKTLTLNGILNAGADTIRVSLAWSVNLTVNEFSPVEDAVVALSENNRKKIQFSGKKQGEYFVVYKPVEGNTYRVDVIVGNKELWAETTVPSKPNATIKNTPAISYYNPYEVSFPCADKNTFYWITAVGMEGNGTKKTKNIACSLMTNCENADDFNRFMNKEDIFRYEHSKYLRINMLKQKDSMRVVFAPQCISRPVEVFLLSVDEHLDKYMKSSLSVEKMDNYTEDMPIIYTPLPVYSNIHGGTGILGSMNKNSRVFMK